MAESTSAFGKIALIITSTRTPRVGPEVARYVKDIIEAQIPSNDQSLSLVDVADFKLPVFDEPVMPSLVPAHASFVHAHSKAWSAEISKYATYIFVTAEYNYGIPGSTKNAIDYLCNEWIGKPVMIVGYGIRGGRIASEQLKTSLQGMKLVVCPTRPALPFADNERQDLYKAAGKGELGSDSQESWKAYKGDILKAFEELTGYLAASNMSRSRSACWGS
jgi:NAD(P)H-dependent FMN reductase